MAVRLSANLMGARNMGTMGTDVGTDVAASYALVAQRTEQGFPKPLVAGSSPAEGASFSSREVTAQAAGQTLVSTLAPALRFGASAGVRPLRGQPTQPLNRVSRRNDAEGERARTRRLSSYPGIIEGPVTHSPCYPLTLSPCHPVTLSPTHPLTHSPIHHDPNSHHRRRRFHWIASG